MNKIWKWLKLNYNELFLWIFWFAFIAALIYGAKCGVALDQC